ncbi:hypothetical protein DPMN_083685 [Dreissena polymorpha]|uniref:Uncharacterized protein n=1 Tax=Dreissena polymorpha TaxID=45954 RepID=A0A9D4BHX8_DREPO|nr:hypothetical protein DPMN_083685 [Dreissena polymorpha]
MPALGRMDLRLEVVRSRVVKAIVKWKPSGRRPSSPQGPFPTLVGKREFSLEMRVSVIWLKNTLQV